MIDQSETLSSSESDHIYYTPLFCFLAGAQQPLLCAFFYQPPQTVQIML
jgi:hypothetical protein